MIKRLFLLAHLREGFCVCRARHPLPIKILLGERQPAQNRRAISFGIYASMDIGARLRGHQESGVLSSATGSLLTHLRGLSVTIIREIFVKSRFAFASALILSFFIQSSAFAAKPTAQDKADAASINSACTQDASATGCSSMVVGKGLLKCMHQYKKQNKAFKFSAGCQAAMKQLRSDRKAGR